MAQGHHGGTRIGNLVRSAQVRQRQVEKAGFVLDDQPSGFGARMPVLARNKGGGTFSRDLALDYGERFFVQAVAADPVELELGPLALRGRVRCARLGSDGSRFVWQEPA